MAKFEQFDDATLERAQHKAGTLELEPREGESVVVQAEAAPEAIPAESTTGEALDIRAEPNEAPVSETPPTSAWGRGWQKFSEGTKRFLKAAYEKVTSSEPVQNAMDRLRIMREEVESKRIEPQIKRARERERAMAAQAELYQKVAADGEGQLKTLQEHMAQVGIGVSAQEVAKIQAQIDAQRSLAGTVKGAEIEMSGNANKWQEQFNAHQKKREAAMKSINDRIEAKREANRVEIAELKAAEEKLVKLQASLEARSGELIKAGSWIAGELSKSTLKEMKKLYEDKLGEVGRGTRELGKTLKATKGELKDIRAKLADLDERNKNLEARKLKSEQPGSLVEGGAMTAETPPEAGVAAAGTEAGAEAGSSTVAPTEVATDSESVAPPAPARRRNQLEGMMASQ